MRDPRKDQLIGHELYERYRLQPLFGFAYQAIFDVIFGDHGRHSALQAGVLAPIVILLAASLVTIIYVSIDRR
jgi:hypothetical protein